MKINNNDYSNHLQWWWIIAVKIYTKDRRLQITHKLRTMTGGIYE